MNTLDNYHVSDAEAQARLKQHIFEAALVYLESGQQVWVRSPMTDILYRFVLIVTESSTEEAKLIGGAENSRGSVSAPSRKGSTKRKATKKGRK